MPLPLHPNVEEIYRVEVQRTTTDSIAKRIAVGGWLDIEIGTAPYGGSVNPVQHFANVDLRPDRMTQDELKATSEAFALAAEAQAEYDNAVAMNQWIR